MIDIDDTSRCPSQDRCEACDGSEDLATVTLDAPTGVFCAVVCEPCRKDKHLPQLSWSEASQRAGAHAMHLGLTLDEVAELQQEGVIQAATDLGIALDKQQPSSGGGSIGL